MAHRSKSALAISGDAEANHNRPVQVDLTWSHTCTKTDIRNAVEVVTCSYPVPLCCACQTILRARLALGPPPRLPLAGLVCC